jgi:NAD(P)-dependent dehydrogenase (short-subunit alcohol dehydrogenase family)
VRRESMTQVNVITGGGSGIGLAAAMQMPKDQIVLITGRSEKRLQGAADTLRQKGIQVETASCDVSDNESVEPLVSRAASLGELRSVIHAAGVSAGQAELDQILRINALGVVHVIRNFAGAMKQNGCIAVIGSCSSASLPAILLPVGSYTLIMRDEDKFVRRLARRCRIVPDQYQQKSIAYCMTKNFVKWYLTHSAYHYARNGVRLVCISPGVVDTALGRTELKNPETQSILRYTGLGRPARPEEIGFLASTAVDERNGYLLGTDIFVDGGCTAAGFGMMAAIRKNSHPKDRGIY